MLKHSALIIILLQILLFDNLSAADQKGWGAWTTKDRTLFFNFLPQNELIVYTPFWKTIKPNLAPLPPKPSLLEVEVRGGSRDLSQYWADMRLWTERKAEWHAEFNKKTRRVVSRHIRKVGIWQHTKQLERGCSTGSGDKKKFGDLMIYLEESRCCLKTRYIAGKLIMTPVWVNPDSTWICDYKILHRAESIDLPREAKSQRPKLNIEADLIRKKSRDAVQKGILVNIDDFLQPLAIIQKNYVNEVEMKYLIENAIRGMQNRVDDLHSSFDFPNVYGTLKTGKTDNEHLTVFIEALASIQSSHDSDVTTPDLIQSAVRSMVQSVDASVLTLPTVTGSGKEAALGVEITIRDGILTVVSPIEDTPAYLAGVLAGDQIVKINGELTKDMSLSQSVEKMRGKEGTNVIISVRREGVARSINVPLIREIIDIKNVKSEALGKGHAYIRLTQFHDRTTDDLDNALKKLTQENGQLKGIVLDLRNNPGGLLSQAVKVSDLFLDSGMIVYTEGRLESQKQIYFAHRGGYTDVPLVVLVNSGSAGASEIVAGAVQDHGRGVVLGAKTFGKGSIQTILPLSYGSSLRLTTARFFTPNGRSISLGGIQPDVGIDEFAVLEFAVLGGDLKKDPHISRALELLMSWEEFQKGDYRLGDGSK